MPKKSTTFNSALEPLTQPLPAETAAAVGSIVQRHAYLDWLLGQVMYDLMEISVKQGRVIMKLPRPRVFIAAVKELFEFHGLEAKFDFVDLARKLELADCVVRELTRSIYMRDTNSDELAIQLVRSPWDPGPGGDLQPEAQPLVARFLTSKRKEVDDAVKAAEKLRALTDKLLLDSHERRARPGYDRRKKR
ncbi:MAG: hypothetical protein ABI789_02595 [Usitatibacter sp.]